MSSCRMKVGVGEPRAECTDLDVGTYQGQSERFRQCDQVGLAGYMVAAVSSGYEVGDRCHIDNPAKPALRHCGDKMLPYCLSCLDQT